MIHQLTIQVQRLEQLLTVVLKYNPQEVPRVFSETQPFVRPPAIGERDTVVAGQHLCRPPAKTR
jgi:hypothetical protein